MCLTSVLYISEFDLRYWIVRLRFVLHVVFLFFLTVLVISIGSDDVYIVYIDTLLRSCYIGHRYHISCSHSLLMRTIYRHNFLRLRNFTSTTQKVRNKWSSERAGSGWDPTFRESISTRVPLILQCSIICRLCWLFPDPTIHMRCLR